MFPIIGATTEENGAVINELAHQYIHSLPRQQEEVVNDMLREFKLSIATIDNKGVEVTSYKTDLSDFVSINLNTIDTTIQEKREKFNRAREKEKFKRKIKEQLEEDYDLYN